MTAAPPINRSKFHGKCRSCNADIYWATFKEGAHPIDRTPVESGPLILALTSAGKLVASHVGPSVYPGRNHYTSHFSTCPNRVEHRKKEQR